MFCFLFPVYTVFRRSSRRLLAGSRASPSGHHGNFASNTFKNKIWNIIPFFVINTVAMLKNYYFRNIINKTNVKKIVSFVSIEKTGTHQVSKNNPRSSQPRVFKLIILYILQLYNIPRIKSA